MGVELVVTETQGAKQYRAPESLGCVPTLESGSDGYFMALCFYNLDCSHAPAWDQ